MTEKFKIYVVNLKNDLDRRKNIINEIEKQNIKNYEIIDAIDGNELSEQELNNLSYKDKNLINPWNIKMSPSQVGCALSHIKIYKKFIKTDYNYALILEDDAVFIQSFNEDLKKLILKNITDKKQILLLSELKEFFSKPIDKNNSYEIVNVTNAFFTHSYIINKEAAKSIIKFNYPVKTIADNFVFFKIYCGIKITGLNPYLVDQDNKNFKTTIFKETKTEKVFLIRRFFYKFKIKIFKKFMKFKTHKI